LPSPAKAPPSGPDWLHEIKHDGFRILARRDAKGVRLITRNGHDFGKRFPQVVAAVAALSARSCLIDGEAIVSDEAGLAVFNLMRRRRSGSQAVLCAFDLLEVRRLPIEERKAQLARLLRKPSYGKSARAPPSRTVSRSLARVNAANAALCVPSSRMMTGVLNHGREKIKI
jgi:ATP-dependent DNA ligase